MICACGCGRATETYKRNKKRSGRVEIAGQHMKYVHGHNTKGTSKALNYGHIIKPSGCWELLCATSDGYAKFWVGTEQHYGHIFYYKKYKGEIPDGLVVDHKCLNKACVNPEHLRLLTRHDNMMVGKFGEQFLESREYKK